MKKWWLRFGAVLAVAVLALSFTNASWLAEVPRGKRSLVALGGIGQYVPDDKVGGCTATAIDPPVHRYIENTVGSLVMARAIGGNMLQIDVAPTKDGRIAVFADAVLDCRTDGRGALRDKTLAELKALDVGHGYTADGGKTFPLRGRGMGAMPELAEVLGAVPQTRILYNFTSDDPREADLLAATLKSAGREVERIGDSFHGSPAQVARMRTHFPKAWAWNEDQARQCGSDYVATGWSGVLPASCEGATMIVPLDSQWMYWGWPNRLIARMEEAGGKVVVTGSLPEKGGVRGLDLPEQLGDVPASFNGYILAQDIWVVGPALYPALDRRMDLDAQKATAALEGRRARQ